MTDWPVPFSGISGFYLFETPVPRTCGQPSLLLDCVRAFVEQGLADGRPA